jgi:hypothetical protein
VGAVPLLQAGRGQAASTFPNGAIINTNLEAVAEAAAARKRWEFLLTGAPLPVRNGTGSPINPIAVF